MEDQLAQVTKPHSKSNLSQRGCDIRKVDLGRHRTKEVWETAIYYTGGPDWDHSQRVKALIGWVSGLLWSTASRMYRSIPKQL